MLQLSRRFKDNKVQLTYDEKEVYEAATTVTTCVIIVAGIFLAYQDHVSDCTAVEALATKYGPALCEMREAEQGVRDREN